MMWRTHVLTGISSLWLLAIIPPGISDTDAMSNVGILAAISAFGALLPDLDSLNSKLTSWSVGGVQPLRPFAGYVYRTWGHRGPLHSLTGLALAGLIAVSLFFWWGWQASAALWLGYASHLAADACTRSGIPFVPRSKRRCYLPPPRLRFVTGSEAEDLLFPFLAAIVLLLLLTHFPKPDF